MTRATNCRRLARVALVASSAAVLGGCGGGGRHATHASIRVTPYRPVAAEGRKDPDYFVDFGKPVRFAGTVSGVTGGTVSLRTTSKAGARHTRVLTLSRTGSFSMTKTFTSDGEIGVRAAYAGDSSHHPSSVSVVLFNERTYCCTRTSGG